MTLSPNSESTTHLGHYGLIAGVFDELDISDLIDDLLPKKSGHNIPHSTVIKAMCINGLGFTERRLYIFPEFFENVPTERLLGEGVLPEHLNDDVSGRTLDKIHEYGATELFSRIILRAIENFPINPLFVIQILQTSVFMVTMKTMMMTKLSTSPMVILNIKESTYFVFPFLWLQTRKEFLYL